MIWVSILRHVASDLFQPVAKPLREVDLGGAGKPLSGRFERTGTGGDVATAAVTVCASSTRGGSGGGSSGLGGGGGTTGSGGSCDVVIGAGGGGGGAVM